MNIHFENVNTQSTSGPNHFASKLIKYIDANTDGFKEPDARLCFIESQRKQFDKIPLFQRLDGIYFNKVQDYKKQNRNIKRTYDNADGVIFESEFNKQLITRYFGEHKNSIVIHNGADVEYIESIKPLQGMLDGYEHVWCCASSWRPHKRLNENIKYFLEHSSKNDCLVIAGGNLEYLEQVKITRTPNVFYVGELNIKYLTALYKRADYFIHLAWLDHCPNVVVDARASGCQIICSSAGGTMEIAGLDAIVIEEDEWDFKPVKLYKPPKMDFYKKVKNNIEVDYNMKTVAKKYRNFIKGTINEKDKTL